MLWSCTVGLCCGPVPWAYTAGLCCGPVLWARSEANWSSSGEAGAGPHWGRRVPRPRPAHFPVTREAAVALFVWPWRAAPPRAASSGRERWRGKATKLPTQYPPAYLEALPTYLTTVSASCLRRLDLRLRCEVPPLWGVAERLRGFHQPGCGRARLGSPPPLPYSGLS